MDTSESGFFVELLHSMRRFTDSRHERLQRCMDLAQRLQ